MKLFFPSANPRITALLAQAESAIERADDSTANHALSAALAQAPDDPAALGAAGVFCAMKLRYARARELLEAALVRQPRSAVLLANLCPVLKGLNDLTGAEQAADRALALQPSNPVIVGHKAELLLLRGETDRARALLAPHLKNPSPHPRLVDLFAQLAQTTEQRERAVALLRAQLDSPTLPVPARRGMLFRLVPLLEALGRSDEAFDAADAANAAASARFDAAAHQRAIDELIAAWPTGAPSEPGGSEADLPVFIVGMPRSGTSLVEQILASHPAVHGADELPDIPRAAAEIARAARPSASTPFGLVAAPALVPHESARQLAQNYLAARRTAAPAAQRVTDKQPLNMLHLGLISRMFPRARIIWCRRDPRDVGLSCYFLDFRGQMPWKYSLAGIGAFLRQTERLMHHWKSVLPNPFFELHYEHLVDNQEQLSRELVGFLGLPWDDRCLRFHESGRTTLTSSNAQVRAPMYRSSIARWRAHEHRLAPLLEALGPLS